MGLFTKPSNLKLETGLCACMLSIVPKNGFGMQCSLGP